MKLIKNIAAVAAAATLLVAMVSCGSTQEAAAPAPAPRITADKAVSSIWEWNNIPLSDIGTSDTVIDEKIVIKPIADSHGAEFAAVAGKAKFKTEDMGTALYHGNKSSAALATLNEVFVASYELTLDAPAKVDLVVSGNGDATPARCLAVFAPDGKVVTSVDNLGQDKKTPLSFEAEKGTYKINLAGMRIYQIDAQAK